MKKQMEILNIFRLPNGQTVLGGVILNHPDLVMACTAKLIIGDEVRQFLHIDGEQIMKKVDENNPLRAVTTMSNVELSSVEAQSGLWVLVFE